MDILSMAVSDSQVLQLFHEHDDFMIGHLKDDQIYYARYSENEGLETVWMAYEDDLPVGCIAFRKKAEKASEVKRLFVKSGYRGQGISKTLLSTLISYAEAQGCRKLYLDTRTTLEAAFSLYRSFGVNAVYQEGVYVQMEKKL